ncbi:MAG: hypothetical protein GF364_03915 [Candidatus Lokiarchaeota archaeon]|nr:hypothetical protein [Candidatus Lokiarchaeota archaeon]
MKIKFRQYKEIENSYRDEYVNDRLRDYPEIRNAKYILTEKIDGANIQLVFNPNTELIIAKRTSIVTPKDKFFNIFGVIEDYKKELDKIQRFVNDNGKSIRIYGELFGKGINRRLPYSEKKEIRFFDAMIENGDEEIYLTQKEFIKFLENLDLKHLFVPIVGYADGLEEAMNYDVEKLESQIAKGKAAEGIVIKLYEILRKKNKLPFFLKKKSKSFEELKPKKKPSRKIDNEVIKLRKEFLRYITKNRLQGIFSKEGMIQSKKEIGKYIGLFIVDARKDFLKDYPEVIEMDKLDQKYIFKVNSDVPKMIISFL